MTVRWFVAKYMSDLRRREPDNVGVVLIHGNQRLSRFLGQGPNGKLDGRRIKWAGSLENYKTWVDYWKHVLASEDGETLAGVLTSRRRDDSYLIEPGGERIRGVQELAPEDLLDQLYEILVEPAFERSAPSVARISESLFHRLAISEVITRGYRFAFEENGTPDLIRFDYRYDNGQVNLMQGVSLANPDERSWDSLHAATWSFSRMASRRILPDKEQQLIALVKTREPDADLKRQVALLTEHAKVVDLVDENVAADHLQQLLHV
jgi:hypothetical protein